MHNAAISYLRRVAARSLGLAIGAVIYRLAVHKQMDFGWPDLAFGLAILVAIQFGEFVIRAFRKKFRDSDIVR